MSETSQDPARVCPDCGHPIPAHFVPQTGEYRGCPSQWDALSWRGSRGDCTRVWIRLWRRGIRKGLPIVFFPDEADATGLLAWDPAADAFELVTEDPKLATRRADPLTIERVREQVEYSLQQRVRIVSNSCRGTKGR